jgi:hypothetical protein
MRVGSSLLILMSCETGALEVRTLFHDPGFLGALRFEECSNFTMPEKYLKLHHISPLFISGKIY